MHLLLVGYSICMSHIRHVGGGQICTESVYIEAKKVVRNLY